VTHRIRLLFLFLLALAVRLPILATQHDEYLSGGITTALGLVARNLLEGRGLVETTGPYELRQLYDLQRDRGKLLDIGDFPDPPDQPTKPLIQRMPGYPVLLAISWKLTGNRSYLPIQLVQVLLSALLPLMLYSAGRRLFGEAAGLTAGILAALHLAEARLAVVPLYDAWIVFLAGFLIWFLARSGEKGYPLADFVWIGLAVAAGTYLKPTVLVLPLFVAAALIPRISVRRALARGAIAFGLPLLALLPWAFRNERVFHRPILTNTFFWATFWEGFGEARNPFGAVLDDHFTYVRVLADDPLMVYASPEYDDYFRPKVLGVIGTRPGFVLSLMGQRLVRGLLFPENPWGIPAVERTEESFRVFHRDTGKGLLAYLAAKPVVSLVKLLQRFWDPFLLVLAFLTLAVDRDRWREFLPLLALPVAFVATTIPLHLEGRYLLPGTLVWILFAAVPLSAWLGGWQERRGKTPESASPAL